MKDFGLRRLSSSAGGNQTWRTSIPNLLRRVPRTPAPDALATTAEVSIEEFVAPEQHAQLLSLLTDRASLRAQLLLLSSTYDEEEDTSEAESAELELMRREELESLAMAMVHRRGLVLQRKVLETCLVTMRDLTRRRTKAINTFQAEQPARSSRRILAAWRTIVESNRQARVMQRQRLPLVLHALLSTVQDRQQRLARQETGVLVLQKAVGHVRVMRIIKAWRRHALEVRRLAFVLHMWAKYLAHYKAMAQRAVMMGHFDGWLDVIQRKGEVKRIKALVLAKEAHYKAMALRRVFGPWVAYVRGRAEGRAEERAKNLTHICRVIMKKRERRVYRLVLSTLLRLHTKATAATDIGVQTLPICTSTTGCQTLLLPQDEVVEHKTCDMTAPSSPVTETKEERAFNFKVNILKTATPSQPEALKPTSAASRPRNFTMKWVPKANATQTAPSSPVSPPSSPRDYLAQMEHHLAVEEPKVAVSSLLRSNKPKTKDTMVAPIHIIEPSNDTASSNDMLSSDSLSSNGHVSNGNGKRKKTRRGPNRGRSRRGAIVPEAFEVPDAIHIVPQAPSPLPAQELSVPPPSDAVVSVDTVLSSSPRAETSGLLTLRRLPVSLRTSGPIMGRRQALTCIGAFVAPPSASLSFGPGVVLPNLSIHNSGVTSTSTISSTALPAPATSAPLVCYKAPLEPQPSFVPAVFVSPPVALFPPTHLTTLLTGLPQAAFASVHGPFAKQRLDVFMHSAAQITQAQQHVDSTYRQQAADIVSRQPGLYTPFLPSATQLLGPQAASKRMAKWHKQNLMQLELPLDARSLLPLLTDVQRGIAHGTDRFVCLGKMVQSAAHALTGLHCSTLKMSAEHDYNVLMAFSSEHQTEAWTKDIARRTPKSAEHTLLGLPLDASPLSLLSCLFILCHGPTTALPPGVLNKARRMIGTPSARAEYVVSLLQASEVLAQDPELLQLLCVVMSLVGCRVGPTGELLETTTTRLPGSDAWVDFSSMSNEEYLATFTQREAAMVLPPPPAPLIAFEHLAHGLLPRGYSQAQVVGEWETRVRRATEEHTTYLGRLQADVRLREVACMELRARLAMGLCSLVHQHLRCVGLYSLMTEREGHWQHIDRRLAYELVNAQGPSVLPAHMVSAFRSLPLAGLAPHHLQFAQISIASLLSVSQRVADDSHYYTDMVQQLAEAYQ